MSDSKKLLEWRENLLNEYTFSEEIIPDEYKFDDLHFRLVKVIPGRSDFYPNKFKFELLRVEEKNLVTFSIIGKNWGYTHYFGDSEELLGIDESLDSIKVFLPQL